MCTSAFWLYSKHCLGTHGLKHEQRKSSVISYTLKHMTRGHNLSASSKCISCTLYPCCHRVMGTVTAHVAKQPAYQVCMWEKNSGPVSKWKRSTLPMNVHCSWSVRQADIYHIFSQDKIFSLTDPESFFPYPMEINTLDRCFITNSYNNYNNGYGVHLV